MTETKKPARQCEPSSKNPPSVYTGPTQSVNPPYEEVDSFWIKPGSKQYDPCDAFERDRGEC